MDRYKSEYQAMIRLAKQHRLLGRGGHRYSFDQQAFDKEYQVALEWARKEYSPPLPASREWEDFIQHKAEASHWKYNCMFSPPVI